MTAKKIYNPTKVEYYLAKTTESKWGIVYWDGHKFWSDEDQDGKLKFGIKREWIVDWYELPSKHNELISENK